MSFYRDSFRTFIYISPYYLVTRCRTAPDTIIHPLARDRSKKHYLTFRISSFGLLMRRISSSGAPSSSSSSRPRLQQDMRYTAITTRCWVSRCSILDMSRSVLTKDFVNI